MKEYVFSYIDKASGASAKKHIARYEGKTEDEAWKSLVADVPTAEKVAGFEVDDTLDKILNAVVATDPAELKAAAEENAARDKISAADKLNQFKASIEQFKNQKKADAIEQKVLQQGKMQQEDWNAIRASMTPEEQKAMYDEFIADADKNHTDKNDAKLEKKFINYIFGVKEKGKWQSDNLTIRDLAAAFGISHVRVLAIQKQALAKLVNNIAKLRKYPFKITTAEEAIALLLADNIANPEDLKLKAKVHGDMNFEEALKKMVKMEKAAKAAKAAKKKADDKKYKAAMKEFKQLEKETNQLRDKLGLPRQYEKFFKFFAGQKLGNW